MMNMTWININERLPETPHRFGWMYESDPVLVWTENGYKVSVFSKRHRMNRDGELILEKEIWNEGSPVLYWMELPKPPTNEK